MAPPTVSLSACSKRFGERLALRKADLVVAPGETVVLLGPNGAGKSTLLRLTAGLLRPTAGTARIDGVDATAAPRSLRARIAYAGHRSQLYRGLTARENLALHARLHRLDGVDLDAALERVGLRDRADERIDGFSRGMLQRLALARALAHEPGLLLLDEPASGLDADGRALLDATLLGGAGTRTQMVASHDPGLPERLGARAVHLESGSLAC
jgi:heme exporter protein A